MNTQKGTLYSISLATICALMAFGLISCNGTKSCTAPNLTSMPESYMQSAEPDSMSIADMAWWKFYGDPLLCDLIKAGLSNNKDVLIAASRIEEMNALYGVAKADLLPTLSADAYANRETNDYYGSKNVIDPEIGIKASLRWEADLWKRLSWAKKKGQAQYEASIEDKRAIDILVISQIAKAYFELMALDSELDIVKRTLLVRSEGLEQAKLRFEGGLTSEMVYRQAEVEYTSTASLVPALEQRIKLTENALRLLIGDFAGKSIPRPQTVLSEVVVNEPSAGIPSQLLTNRPDLRASEWRLKSAMADVGIAYADRFPRFTIGLTGGVENNEFANMLRSPFSYMVGGLAGPLFDFGRKKKNYEAAKARYDQARLSYEKGVMTAFKEVADALTSYQSARATAQLKTDLRDAAMKYVELSRLQYLGGSSLYIDVLDAQRRYFDAQIALSNAVRDEYLALVSLYKSVGGGWNQGSTEPDSDGTVDASAKTEL